MMGSRKSRSSAIKEVTEFLNQLLVDKPVLPFVVPFLLVFWGIEKWFFSLSNWVPLGVAVWATVQYGSYQRRILAEDLNKKWKQVILQTSPTTPLEHCEWLNKLLIEIWPKYIGPKLSLRFSSIVERRLKHRRPKLIEKIELQEFSLGKIPPILGLHGTSWCTSSGDQKIMRMGFDWDTTDINIMLFAKLAKPLMGTARIVINNIHIKGDLLLMPVLEGRAVLYSFVSTPEVRIGVAFGSGGSQSLPATELPGVSSWLVKLITDTLNKRMVEPRRNCLSLPAVDLYKKAVAGVLHVTVISASKLSKKSLRGSPSKRYQNSDTNGSEENPDSKDLLTFVEVEIEELTRRTHEKHGSNPRWDSTFNMVLHDNAGLVKFNLYECNPGNVKYDFLTSCEVKVRYGADDSTIFWATGTDSSVIAQHAEMCGKEIEMTVPFEGENAGELMVKLVLKEWQFSDGSRSLNSMRLSSRQSQPLNGSSNILPTTGRKVFVTVVEGKNLIVKDKLGRSDPFVKLHYGKAIQRTRSAAHTSDPIWNQKFEFDEIGDGEYLKIKCYTDETFGEESIGSARVNMEGLIEGSPRDVWIPLEKVNSGELHLQIETVMVEDEGSSKGHSSNGWIEIVLIEARDLVAADLRGTSDPYVRINYGNLKRKTKVIYKTLQPQWHQTFEFPDNGSALELLVKDHNALLPEQSIGHCVVEYKRLPPNHMADKWIPLQNVKKGEIHVQVTKRVPELDKKPLDSESSSIKGRQRITKQMKQTMIKVRGLVEDGNVEGISATLTDLESLHDTQEEYVTQLEMEQMLLLNKINELGQEILNSSSPTLNRRATVL